MLALLAILCIALEASFAPQRGLLRESGKGEVVSSSFPHWPWALVDGCSFFHRDVFQPSDWLRLSGVLWQGDGRGKSEGGELGRETWRIRHQGKVRVQVGEAIVFEDETEAEVVMPLDASTRIDEFDVTWTGDHVPFTLTVNGGIERVGQKNGLLHVELERKNAFGRWRPLPPAALYPEAPSASAARLARVLGWLGLLARIVLFGVVASWAIARLIRSLRQSPGPLAIALVAASAAFAVRMIFVMQRMETDWSFWGISLQADHYLFLARRAIAGGGYPWGSQFSPGNTWWMMLLTRLVGPSIFAVVALNVAVASLGIGAIALATRRLFGTALAWVVALIAVFYPPLVFYHSTVQIASMGTTLLMFLVLCIVWLSEYRSLRTALAAGLLIGLSALFRPTALIFLPVLIAWLLRGQREDADLPRVPMGRRVALCATLLLGAASIVTTQAVLNHRAGIPVLIANNTSLNIILGNNQDATGDYAITDAFSEANAWLGKTDAGIGDFIVREVRTSPTRLFLLQLRKFGRFVTATEHANVLNLSSQGLAHSPWLKSLHSAANPEVKISKDTIEIPWFAMSTLSWLAITGLVLVFRRTSAKWRVEQRPASRVLAIMLALYVLATVAVFVNGRIRIPAIALMLPFVAFGIQATMLVLLRPSKWTIVPVLSGVLVAGAVWCSTNMPPERFHDRLPESATPFESELGAGLHLAGFEEVSAVREHGGYVYVRLYWGLTEATDKDLTVDVSLFDPESDKILVNRRLKVGTVSPPNAGTSTWPAGSIVSETLYFKVTKVMPNSAVLRAAFAGAQGAESEGAPIVVAPITLVE